MAAMSACSVAISCAFPAHSVKDACHERRGHTDITSQRKPGGRLHTWLDVVQDARLCALRHPRTSQSAGPRAQKRELRLHRLSGAAVAEERHWQILDERGVDGHGHGLRGAVRGWPARHFWCVPSHRAWAALAQRGTRAAKTCCSQTRA